jgi:hypothetical protein
MNTEIIVPLDDRIEQAIEWLLNVQSKQTDLPPGELRRLLIMQFGEDIDAELQRRFMALSGQGSDELRRL